MATIKKGIVIKKVFISIFFPLLITLIVLAFYNFYKFQDYTSFSNKSKNKDIFTEIVSAVEFQDLALSMIESEAESRLKNYSDRLVNDFYPKLFGLHKANLTYLRKIMGMDEANEDIYIIDTLGVVVNTTFEKDKGINLFQFGEKHKTMLKNMFTGGSFVSERFTIEASTKRLKKYCYQPTKDGKYLIEIGLYSKSADETVNFIKKRLADFSKNNNGIVSVDFFIAADTPFSLSKDVVLDNSHIEYIQKAISTKDRQILNIEVDNKIVNYEYIYVPLKNTYLYKDAVIRIISNRTGDSFIFTNLVYSLVIFGSVFLFSLLIFLIQVARYRDYQY
ncbi:MAG: hypothetical protein A2275_09635 [Bacteroidetes bacterium RIFOXYA12_FULL_35_11]|nr:MAG: hypothetical protein A2X01_08605 [Bacteroidetes bacterium GWF2_35_48]OFY74814.1 MAG: hypothetical protein A2275_09635 [Bacteroidetes bacterium RIFOXYA12_FULL_35_11]OFY94942.1 MAG: hypothetical protein A2309_03995 [Bacteroidetes bacterium RIFOXYB2_FULL_35_7]OFY97940.1 MAG: hypothetical protein A2491_03615 [Bacteroidetes bacterium RIFOXYC12_FULL_35_7]HBX52469.1 hypothetical protein [Bacteroidales bacterium]